MSKTRTRSRARDCNDSENAVITVSQQQYPISILEPLKSCQLGEKLYMPIKSFLQSSNATVRLTVELDIKKFEAEIEEFSSILEKIRKEIGPSYRLVHSSMKLTIFNFEVKVHPRINPELIGCPGYLSREAIVFITVSPKWPDIEIPLPSNTICPLDGRRQCFYCKWWYKSSGETCASCKLYQMDDFIDEKDIPCLLDQQLPDAKWIQIGGKINGNVFVGFPSHFQYDKSQLLNVVIEHRSESFMNSQIVRWFWRNIGRNPTAGYFDFYRDESMYESDAPNLITMLTSHLHPLCVTINVVELNNFNHSFGNINLRTRGTLVV